MSISPSKSPDPLAAKKTSATDTFDSATEFVSRLRLLRQLRRERKLKFRHEAVRESLSGSERDEVLAKTGGQCHICGGEIGSRRWEADHVVSHSLGGRHSVDNYLASDPICNGYRWFYEPEEFQWILKLGVWLRTHIERKTTLGRLAAAAFWAHECARESRRKKHNKG